MYQYFAFNIIYSALVFMYLFSLKTAPFRMRFRLVVLALVSWFIPYDIINELLTQGNNIAIPTVISEFNGDIKQSIVSQVNNETFMTLLNLIKTLTLLGLIWFIRDVLSIKSEQKKLNNCAKFYKEIGIHKIYMIDEDDIYTIGLFNPKIIIGEKYLNSTYTDSIIKHELQHIKNKDQFWLLLITFTQRLLWWNPIVNLLATKARELIELSCDQACKKHSKDNQYQKDLAQILIQTNQKLSPLASHFFGQSKLNIYRIKQLSMEFTMNTKNIALIFSTAIIPFVLLLLVSTTSVSSDLAPIDKEGKPVILANDEVDITIDAILAISVASDGSTKKQRVEARMIQKFGEPLVLKSDELSLEVEATSTKIDDNSIILETKITYIIDGKKYSHQPSLMILNNNEASTIIKGDNHTLELNVLPRF